ncbi:Hypothetical protein PHPALM_8113 [Phytophthora palmivora]|uniref:Uncharacterized protein n=1 Tax=Phytophthora palmivora TaxID=4796 RepID=A0A2P4YAM8_9STRA|nr:Hypothetical protein PHPALM_8113 [Phytophthora palmivora]
MKFLPCEDSKPSSSHQTSEPIFPPSTEQKVIEHQAAVINHFIEHMKLQNARMGVLEAKMNDTRKRGPISKKRKSGTKRLVAYVKLLLNDGFVLDTTEACYRDQVLSLGIRAEKPVLMFLEELSISSRGSGAVLKHLRSLHRTGALNAKIERHDQLLQTPAIQDPDPGYTHNILEQIR